MTSRIEYNNPEQNGNFCLPYHYEMVSDKRRMGPFKEAIERVCSDKIVLESGTGSGILSLLALRAGAKMVYSIEIDPLVSELARKNIERNRNQNIRLLQKDVLKVTLKDLDYRRIDVIIAENLSTWLVTEPQIEILNYITEYIAPKDAIRLPTKIFNYVELAESQYCFEDLVEIKTHYFQFSGIKSPKILSEKALFKEFDLRTKNPIEINDKKSIEVSNDGIVNSLRLTSPLEVYRGIKFEGSDSLMPPVIVPLDVPLKVYKKDQVNVHISYSLNTSWYNFRCYIES